MPASSVPSSQDGYFQKARCKFCDGRGYMRIFGVDFKCGECNGTGLAEQVAESQQDTKEKA